MQFLLKQVLKREPDSPKELKEQAKILCRYFASVQGAESPRSGAYCLYVSTEDDESNAEMTYKSKQKFCAAILVLAQGVKLPRSGAYP